MKTQSIMKKSRVLYPSLLLAGMALLFSCSKDESVDPATSVTEDDAAELVTQSVSPSDGGMVVQLQDAATVSCTPAYLSLCNVPKDSTISGDYSGGGVNWSYSFTWGWLLTCDEGVPQTFAIDFHGNTDFDGPRMTIHDTGYGNINVTGLANLAQVTVNGVVVRSGEKVSKIGRQLTFTGQAIITATDVVVNRINKKILSGTATVHVTGESSAGRSFDYTGTLTFNGNNSCRLRWASGRIFNFFW